MDLALVGDSTMTRAAPGTDGLPSADGPAARRLVFLRAVPADLAVFDALAAFVLAVLAALAAFLSVIHLLL
jgi:hypothetical protein